MKKTTIKVYSCSRCGENHDIDFTPLTKISDEWTHWGFCPKTNEPVMMKFVDVSDNISWN